MESCSESSGRLLIGGLLEADEKVGEPGRCLRGEGSLMGEGTLLVGDGSLVILISDWLKMPDGTARLWYHCLLKSPGRSGLILGCPGSPSESGFLPDCELSSVQIKNNLMNI